MRTYLIAAALAALSLSACSPPSPTADAPPAAAPAPEAAGPAITVSDGWVAATPGGASVAAGYMTIANAGPEDTLLAISSPRAPRVEIHEMTMTDGMMTMRAKPQLVVPAQGAASLAPGGDHVMFMDIPAPFVAGESVPVTLMFAHAGAVEATLTVRDRTAQP